MNKRIFWYLFLPILFCVLALVFIIIFNLKIQIITILGSIFSAFVAMYIAETNRFNDNEAKLKNKVLMLKYSISLIPKIIADIEKEITNYEKYLNDIIDKDMENISIESMSFYYLKEFDKVDKNDLFNSISSVGTTKNIDLSDEYLKLISDLNNVLYIKETLIEQIKRLIFSFNEQSEIMKDSMLKINDFFLSILNKKNKSDSEILLIVPIRKWNDGLKSGSINLFSYKDNKDCFITPLMKSDNEEIFNPLKSFEVALDKHKELRMHEIAYLEDILNKMKKLKDEILIKKQKLESLLA